MCRHSHAPAAEHTSPLAHVPHVAPPVPHDAGDSEAQGTHAPVALQHPSGHELGVHSHVPPVHTWPAEHPWPQVPQFASSVARSLQTPEHDVVPGSQTQAPDEHTWSVLHAPHAAPPVPHDVGDSCAHGTHAPLALQHPFGHDAAVHSHVPAEHTCPAPHALPQPPQLASSLVSSTHAPPHAAYPELHAVAHALAAHVAWE